MSNKQRQVVAYGAVVVTIVAILAEVHQFWGSSLVDDAYISFVYAGNLLDGHGLVYNIGERVEGYTNFGFVLAVAVAQLLGFEPSVAARAIGAGFLLVTAALLWRIAGLPSEMGGASRGEQRYGVLLIPLLPSLVQLAVSGLEVAVVSGLVLLLGYLLFVARTSRGWHAAVVNLCALALVWTRMELILFVAVAALVQIAPQVTDLRGGRWKAVLREAGGLWGPFALACLVQIGWRYAYYGDIVPNTYHAKLASEWSIESGLGYLWEFVQAYHFVWLGFAPFFLLGLFAALAGGRFIPSAPVRTVGLFRYLGISSFVYGFYIVKCGGDFMEFRFVYHVLPAALAVCWLGLWWVFWRPPRASSSPPDESPRQPSTATKIRMVSGHGVALLGIAAAGWAGWNVAFPRGAQLQSIATMHSMTADGERIGSMLRSSLPHDTVIATTLAGTMRLYSGLATVDEWGLNDGRIGRQDVHIHYRGHMKRAQQAYLVERGVNFDFAHPQLRACSRPCLTETSVSFRLGNQCLCAEYLLPSDSITETLRQGDRVSGRTPLTTSELRTRWTLWEKQKRFDPTWARDLRRSEQAFAPDDPLLSALRTDVAHGWTFDDGRFPEGTETTGRLAEGIAGGHRSHQRGVSGHRGAGLINTFTLGRGTVRLPPVVLPPDGIHLLIGGFNRCRETAVIVELDGKEIARACSKDRAQLSSAVLRAPRYAGREVRVVLVVGRDDEDLLVDDIIVPRYQARR